MCNHVYKKGGKKVCRPITTRVDYMKACNSTANLDNWRKYRETGEDKYKRSLVEIAYNCQVPDGEPLKGNTTVSPFFFYDIDCADKEECRRIMKELVERKDELQLVEVSQSASYGVHAVGRRIPGTTILENQVRLSIATKTEMDTNNKENNRVVFHGPIDPSTTPLLEDALFTERLSEEEAAKEYKRLKERERRGEEQVPVGAKKANKHYRPWEDAEAVALDRFVPRDDAKRQQSGNDKNTPQDVIAGKDPQFPQREGIAEETPKAEEIADQVRDNNVVAEKPSNRTMFIAQGVMKEKNLKPSDFLNEGGRHTTVKIFLSGATQLLTKAEANGILSELMPEHWNDENIQQLVNDFYENYTNPSQKLFKYQEELFTQSQRIYGDGVDCFVPRNDAKRGQDDTEDAVDDLGEEELSTVNCQLSIKKLPQGVRESIEAVGPSLAMPVITAICPCIGALATGVELDVHGQKKGLNLIAYIAGDFASGKGQIDPVVDAWMSEVRALDKMYQMQEDEWRAKKRAAKNKKEQPEEPKLPVRYLTLNNTVANLAERLANTEGKHAFSFTPEADTVAQKWKSTLSDFSIMLRQSYDGTKYEREARSADAVNVHIEKLLWNVTMCGTPDALYRVVSNYTDGFQSRIAVARTPDNTFAPLEDKPYVLTDRQTDRIQQIAHLLPLMQGEVVLPKLEAKGREWLERVRLETLKDDDKVMARQRFRVCVTAQRMTCCLMLCKVCETLIQKYGLTGAEARLKQFPDLWKEMLLKTQTPQMLDTYDTIADALMENALHFFRDRIENAFSGRDYSGCLNGGRTKHGKNDSIFSRLDHQFSFEQAMQQSVAIKGADVTRNSVQQMLKNWSKQGLVVQTDGLKYRKC